MKSKVALIECPDYEKQKVMDAVKEGIHLLGGLSEFVTKSETLLLKPNLLAGDPPEKGVTTHPSVFRAVARLFRNDHRKIIYGDSPGLGNPERIAKKTGIMAIAEEMGIPLADFVESREISFPEARVAKKMVLAKGALESDGIISIGKMKTHALTRITGAVKNTFGCVPGFAKKEYHLKMNDIELFSAMLVDLNSFLKPRLFILDGIIAMEGNGPRGGDVIPMNVLLFSPDPVALDAVFCRLINLRPELVPYLRIGYEAGLGTYKEDEIELLGQDINKLIKEDFLVERTPVRKPGFLQNLSPFFKNLILAKPIIDLDRCTNCGSCMLQCPVPSKAINWDRGNKKEKPKYDYSSCIRCFCCQEICQEKAISVRIPFMGKMIFR